MFFIITGSIVVFYLTGFTLTRTVFRSYLLKNNVFRYRKNLGAEKSPYIPSIDGPKWFLEKLNLGADYVPANLTDAQNIFVAARDKSQNYSWGWFIALPVFFLSQWQDTGEDKQFASFVNGSIEKKRSEVLLAAYRLDNEQACADAVEATTFDELIAIQAKVQKPQSMLSR